MTSDPTPSTFVHVIFTADGLPRWFGPAPVAGSEPLDLQELVPLLPDGSAAKLVHVLWRDLLIGHRRVDGHWQVRPMVVPPEPESVESGIVAEAVGETENEFDTGEGADI